MSSTENKLNKPDILDCTLRDGSYEIDFQFSYDDTVTIAAALDKSGIKLIEVGHGIGLGASEAGLGVAADTDENYMKAAATAISSAKWGMFCIPGIANLAHLNIAKDYGMDFIRIGTNVDDYKKAYPFIEKAKALGMTVCSNFMKSYTSEPSDFAEIAHDASEKGSDFIYIVDSAGGMLPQELKNYIHIIKGKFPNIKLGFHGHNNLGLGMANSLIAQENGVELIDTSLQGFGRSAGNTATEHFICALMRKGILLDIDPIELMTIGEKHIKPLIQKRGLSSIDITSGLGQFHSSYMPIITDVAKKYRVDPRRLIIAVCQHDQLNAPKPLVEKVASLLQKQDSTSKWQPLYQHYAINEQGEY
ncbi:hypothetical protein tinsulaeT_09770 [Thalassotalea insulae]|uniref:Pyruvate carboxyltransferase domain-containing protein n=1 Tax=Thalassotalea insulae TaxID=2056778 RepID=A0ABQ6GNW7_9GAMM|nr:4-hydroxy-2-oxovalerate aldolase [Thalassotalea insulae]GLX77637.1 hypothetical protein tinsulaeT_09770 [Thalassotalea insulae]